MFRNNEVLKHTFTFTEGPVIRGGCRSNRKMRMTVESSPVFVLEDSAEGSYIQDMQTGRKTKLHKNGGTYAVDLWVLSPREGVVQEVPRLDNVEFSSEGPPSLCDSSEDEAKACSSEESSSESEDEVQTFRRHAPRSA